MPEETSINTVLGRVNTAIDNLQTAQQTVVDAVQQLHTHVADPQAHGVDSIEADITQLQTDVTEAQSDIINIKADYVEKEDISDSISLNSSTNIASSKAVKILNDTLQSDYVAKADISNAIDSTSETDVASSKAVKDLSDSIEESYVAKSDILNDIDSESESNVASSKAVSSLKNIIEAELEDYIEKTSISDSTSLNSSTNVASSKAVKDLADTAESTYIKKSSISDAINSESTSNVASSKAVKDLKDDTDATYVKKSSISNAIDSTSETDVASSKAVKDLSDSVEATYVGKSSISDSTSSNSSTDVASSKAVKDAKDTIEAELEDYILKSSISNAIDSENTSNVASSKAVKDLSDAIYTDLEDYIEKTSISDSLSLDSSTNVASSKAVKSLADTVESDYIPKSSISDAINSESTSDVASSNAVKSLNDSIHTDLEDYIGKSSISDSIALDSSSNVASSKAVKDLSDNVEASYVAKADISNAIDSTSETDVASSKAVKDAKDTIEAELDDYIEKSSISDSLVLNSSDNVASSKSVKNLKDTLNNVESTLSSVSSVANSANTQATTNKNNISLIFVTLNGKTNNSDFNALAGRVSTVEEKQTADEGDILDLQTAISGYASDIESLDSRVTQNESDIESISSNVNTCLSFLEDTASQEGINNFNDIKNKLDEIDTTTDNLDAKFGDYIPKNKISDSVRTNDSTAVASSTAVKTAYDLANTANTQATTNTSNISQITNRLTTSEQDIDALESSVSDISDSIDSLETRVTANEAQTQTNKQNITTINSSLGTYATKASISDRVDFDNSNYIASSKAVKTAYDLANTANTKANNITSTAALKANIKDSINSSSSTDMASSLAVKTVNDALVTLTNTVNAFLSGEPDDGTIDRLSELVREIQNNRTDLDDVLANKVSKSDISDAINSNSSTNVASSKAVKTVQDNIPLTATATPLLASGNGSVGTSSKWAKEDHVHPEQTTITGNAGTATALETARTIEISGDASGSASFDGTSNIDIEIAIADDSHNHVISNVDGLQTALNGKSNTGHGHSISDTTGLQDALDGKSNVGHGHSISDVEALQTALDGKAPFSHNQASNTIDAMTGYSKPSSGSAISASDTLNSAVGKLEAKADTHAIDNEVVHLAGDEDITGTKTFVGSKKVSFKQGTANDKLGFTLFNNSGKEQGYLEYNPTNKISGAPLFTLGNYATAANELSYIGFRRYSTISGASGAYNLLAPLIADAKRHFNLTTTYTNFFLMLGITDGTNTVSADNGGVVDISTLASGSCTGNSASATEFESNQSVTLTGDATGTSSSKAGWSVPVTLANTGVDAGRYTSVNVDSKGRVTAGNVRHSYTTTANSAKDWYRIANADYGPIDIDHPLMVQFIITMYNTDQNSDYYQRWFVQCEVFGRTSGIHVLGGSSMPFSQMRVVYENTVGDVDSTDKPAIDIYLNYALATSCHVEIEEVYNSGWSFVSNGTLSSSTIPTGFETRAVNPYPSGISNASWADYATRAKLERSNISANATLGDSNTYRAMVLNCTNTITLTLPSTDSSYAWFLIKNHNASSGTVTIHPSTTSVLIDGSNSDIVLQPHEWIMIASKAANEYVIVNDGRWMHQLDHLNGLTLADIPLGTLLGEVSTSSS